jgi:hypothetical protein
VQKNFPFDSSQKNIPPPIIFVQSNNFFRKNNVFLEFQWAVMLSLMKQQKTSRLFFKESVMPNIQSHALYLKCLKPQPHPEKNDCLVVTTDLPGAMIRDAIESLQFLSIPHQLITLQGRTNLCLSRSAYEEAMTLRVD